MIPEVLLRIMDSTRQDFAIGIWEEGLTRSNDNYNAQKDKSGVGKVLFGTVLFGELISDAHKSKTTMACFIIDRQNRNLAFYRKLEHFNRDPTNKNDIRALLRDLVNSYFNMAK